MFIINKIKLLNYFICFISLSLIIGNLAVNLNIIIICVLGLTLYGKKTFLLENKKIQYLLYSFFFYLIFITFFHNYLKISLNNIHLENTLKSIFFIRFLILFLIINKMIEKNELDIKLIFTSFAFFSLILSIDIIIQVVFGKNLLGNEITLNRPSGFFGTENIAGGYLQKFLIFLIFLIPIYLKKIKNKKIYVFFIASILVLPIFLTLNRMPLIIYFMSIILYFLIEKEFKKILFFVIIFNLLLFFFLKYSSKENFYKLQIENTIRQTSEIIINGPELFINNSLDKDKKLSIRGSGYLIHFNSGIQIWKQNKIFGLGLKSFRSKCKYEDYQTCSTHPHNYFIEIILDTGLVGLILIYSIFIIGLKRFIKFYFLKIDQKEKYISIPFFLIIFFEFFPFRSSGSFFTTNNAIIIFMMMAIFINSHKLKFNNFIKKQKIKKV